MATIWRPVISGHAPYQNALQQKAVAKAAIARGDAAEARGFARSLIDRQGAPGEDSEYASESLCDLAQHAKAFGNFALQLELAVLATEAFPSNGLAHCHAADAYMSLLRLEEARKALQAAKANGQPAYTASGYARILRLQSRRQEALIAFEAAVRDFPDSPQAWAGRAEVLREMWRLEDALNVYNSAIKALENVNFLLWGRANVYKELGDFQLALEEYDKVNQLWEDEPFGLNGRADVLAEMGKLDDAATQYRENIALRPGDSVAYCGLADTLLKMGREADALSAYGVAQRLSPEMPIAAGGYVNALIELRRYAEAEAAYRKAIQQFPSDAAVGNAFAKLLKRRGQFDESLRQYDFFVRARPFDIAAQISRADLLKELGRLDEARSAYEQLRLRAPRDKRIGYSLAAVLAAQGAGDPALQPSQHPRTQADWIGQHLLGAAQMKRGELVAAEAIFRKGVTCCPWAEEKVHFDTALAVCLLAQRRWPGVLKAINVRDGATGLVLKLHASGMLRDPLGAALSYQRVRDYCPPLLIPVRDELASRFVLNRAPRQTESWLLEQEVRAILLRGT